MRARLLAISVCILYALVINASANAERTLEIYLIDPCGACMGAVNVCSDNCVIEDEAYVRYSQLAKQLPEPCRVVLHNVRKEPEAYNQLVERLENDAPQGFELPVIMIDDAAFPADGSADDAVLQFLQTGEYSSLVELQERKRIEESKRSTRRVLYFFSAYCEDCKSVSKWIDHALPLDVEIVRVDIATAEGMLLEQAVHSLYGISEEEFHVPLIIWGDQWLMGKQSIMFALPSRIIEFPDVYTRTPSELLQTMQKES